MSRQQLLNYKQSGTDAVAEERPLHATLKTYKISWGELAFVGRLHDIWYYSEAHGISWYKSYRGYRNTNPEKALRTTMTLLNKLVQIQVE